MLRNLEKRVEALFPVLDQKLRAQLIDVINAYFKDNCQAAVLDNNGQWTLLTPPRGEKPYRVQKEMLELAAKTSDIPTPVKMEYTVRRSPPTEK